MATMRERVRKDGSVAYQVLWPNVDGDGKQVPRTFDLESEAVELFTFLNSNGNSFKMAEKAVTRMRSKAPTVLETIKLHIDSLGGEVEPGTVGTYRGMLPIYFPKDGFGGIPIDLLSVKDVRTWFDGIKRAHKTKKNVHAVLSAALNRAARADNPVIRINVAEGIRDPKSTAITKERMFLTRKEAKHLVKAMPDHYKLFAEFILGTGVRFGEVTALRPSAFQRVGDRLTVRITESWKRHAGRGNGVPLGAPKTRKGVRTITLSEKLAKKMKEHLKGIPRDELVFRNENGGTILHATLGRNVWNPTMKELVKSGKLDAQPTPHDLRHTHASWLIERGVPLPVIQIRLGHESIKTTVDTYGHLAIDADAKAADALD